jgi:hypothetical protein
MNRFIIFLAFIFIYACSSNDKVESAINITGKVRLVNNGNIFLERLTPEGFKMVDSCSLDGERFFELSAPEGDEGIYRINFFGRQKVSFATSGDDIHIMADGNNPNGQFEASGSRDMNLLSRAYQLKIAYRIKTDLLDQKLRTARSIRDSIKFIQIMDSLSILKQTFADSLKHIIRSEDGNLMAFLIMEEHLDFETHIDFYKEQLPVFEQNLGDHWYFKQVNQQFQDIKKLALGSIAPDFTLPDSTGQPISLSSFRGKYLFLDFWASWCQPCRRDNPRYLSIYNEFSNDNFEILGVSFDRKRENWLKAIENDGLKMGACI